MSNNIDLGDGCHTSITASIGYHVERLAKNLGIITEEPEEDIESESNPLCTQFRLPYWWITYFDLLKALNKMLEEDNFSKERLSELLFPKE